MNNVNEKSKYANTRKNAFFCGVALLTIMCTSSVSYAMEFTDKELLTDKFHIKNIKMNKYMLISNKVKEGGGHKAVLGGEKNEADVFIFEKSGDGFKIRKDGTDQYLFSSRHRHLWFGSKYLAAQENPHNSRKYFEFEYKENGEYQIKNTYFKEYLFFTDKFQWDWRSIALSEETFTDKSIEKTYFLLERVGEPNIDLVEDNLPEAESVTNTNQSSASGSAETDRSEQNQTYGFHFVETEDTSALDRIQTTTAESTMETISSTIYNTGSKMYSSVLEIAHYTTPSQSKK